MSNKLTHEEFLIKANIVHFGRGYVYLEKYTSSRTKMRIICPEHGEFSKSPNNHLCGEGCPKCAKIIHDECARNASEKNRIKASLEFEDKANVIHNFKYKYPDPYIHCNLKMKIMCQKHGEFFQKPRGHLEGNGCPKCAEIIYYENRIKNVNKSNYIRNTKASLAFEEKANKVHSSKYKYPDQYINGHTKIKIVCPLHDEFYQIPSNHLSGNGCPVCNSSTGELKIKKFFEDNNIKFIPQKTFNDCKGKRRKLPFDFYLLDYNILIEYQGKQHFEVVDFMGGEDAFNKLQVTDKLKKDYCFLKGIRLLEITYKDDPIKVLKEFLCENSSNPLATKDLIEFL